MVGVVLGLVRAVARAKGSVEAACTSAALLAQGQAVEAVGMPAPPLAVEVGLLAWGWVQAVAFGVAELVLGPVVGFAGGVLFGAVGCVEVVV